MKNPLSNAVDETLDQAVADKPIVQSAARKKNTRPMHYISRLEEPEAGWQVDIGADNNRWQSLFADQAHGGREPALALAKAWRDAARAEIRRAKGKAEPGEQRISTNASGLVGVRRNVSAYMTLGGVIKEVATWVAQWKDLQGKQQVRSFSVNRYGEAQAQAMALRARQEAEQALEQHAMQQLAMASAIVPLAPSSADENPEMRYLSRCDAARAHRGWEVSITRQNKHWHKYFGDAAYGGKAQALAAAQAWRDEVGPQLSGPQYDMWRRTKLTAKNTSGTVGVSRSVRTVVRKNGSVTKSVSWIGYWTELDGKVRSRSFSVKKYGEQEAKAMADRYRQDGLAQRCAEIAQRPWAPDA